MQQNNNRAAHPERNTMITILDSITDMPLNSFLDRDICQAIEYILLECPPDAEVYQGPDVEHANGVPAAQWVQEIALPYATTTTEQAQTMADYATATIADLLN